MADQAAPITVEPIDVRQCQSRHRPESPRGYAPAVTDRLAPSRSATRTEALPRPRPDAEICGGEVSWRPPNGLLRLDVGRPDHLAPLLGFGGDKLPEFGG